MQARGSGALGDRLYTRCQHSPQVWSCPVQQDRGCRGGANRQLYSGPRMSLGLHPSVLCIALHRSLKEGTVDCRSEESKGQHLETFSASCKKGLSASAWFRLEKRVSCAARQKQQARSITTKRIGSLPHLLPALAGAFLVFVIGDEWQSQ